VMRHDVIRDRCRRCFSACQAHRAQRRHVQLPASPIAPASCRVPSAPWQRCSWWQDLVCHGRNTTSPSCRGRHDGEQGQEGNRGNQKVGRKRISTWVGNLPSWLAIRQWCF
jgi:hypothetical protein